MAARLFIHNFAGFFQFSSPGYGVMFPMPSLALLLIFEVISTWPVVLKQGAVYVQCH